MLVRILRLVAVTIILILAAYGLFRLFAGRAGVPGSGSITVTNVTALAPVSRGQILSQLKLITAERQFRIPVLGETFKPMPSPERDGMIGEVTQAVFGQTERIPGTTQNLVYEMVTTVTAGIDLGKLRDSDIENGDTVTTITLPQPEILAVIHDAAASKIFSQDRPTMPFVGNPATLLEAMQKQGEKKHRQEAANDEALLGKARANAEESLLRVFEIGASAKADRRAFCIRAACLGTGSSFDNQHPSPPSEGKKCLEAAFSPQNALTHMATLEELRSQIDEVDRKMVALLDERADLAKAIGAAKLSEGRTKFYDASRQKKVVENAIAAGSGAFPAEALRNVFVEVMSASLALERAPTVGYLGPEATFSHQAALSEFGNSVLHQPYDSVYDIFFATDRDWIDYGVVPIENSTGGVIHTHLDMFLSFELLICSEINLHIHQNLISRNPLDQIKTIYSKAEPFQQCQVWLKENLPGVQLIEVGATSKGVEMSMGRDYAAAIGSEIAARKYGVPIIARNIEDMKDNTTRFVVIGKQKSPPTGNDKTSVMLSIKDRPGALFELLQPLHDRGINLTKIESRPTRVKAWDYVFFIDMLGHLNDPPIAESLELLKSRATSMRIMGSYPRDAKIRDGSAGDE